MRNTYNWNHDTLLVHTGKLNQARAGTLRSLRIGLVQKCKTVGQALAALLLKGKRPNVSLAKSSIRWMVRNGYLERTG